VALESGRASGELAFLLAVWLVLRMRHAARRAREPVPEVRRAHRGEKPRLYKIEEMPDEEDDALA
jgi:hypothetical protein